MTFFSNIVSTYLPQVNTSAPNYDKLKSYIDSKLPDEVNFDIPPISYDFVLNELSSLDSKKAIGADGLSSRLLKLTAKPIATPVTMIMNLSISCSKFPTAWKLAKICPIFKRGKRDNRSNYRPISILSVLSKILEKHVHIHLYQFLTIYNLLHLAQSGSENCTHVKLPLLNWHQNLQVI